MNLPSTRSVIRLAKAVLSLVTGINTGLIAYDNLTDYQTGFDYVKHVLSMDTTYPDNAKMPRAITSSRIHHAAYLFINLIESITAVLCIKGGIDMLKNIDADTQTFDKAKRTSIAGMLSGLLLWFLGFQVIASEWFGMWMSKRWNAMPDVTRLTQFTSTMLIFISMKNDD